MLSFDWTINTVFMLFFEKKMTVVKDRSADYEIGRLNDRSSTNCTEHRTLRDRGIHSPARPSTIVAAHVNSLQPK